MGTTTSRKKMYLVRYENEENVRAALLEIFMYLCFLIVTTITVFSLRHVYMYYFNETIERLFLRREEFLERRAFADLVTIEDWWNFLEFDFLPNLHGNDSNANKRTFLNENILLGPPRLRQIRVRNDTCHVDVAFDGYFKTCYAEYSTSVEDTSPMYKGTRYYTLAELGVVRIWARLATYVGGGYVKDLTFDLTANLAIISDLRNISWIDRGSRMVLIEFGLYNTNTKLFDNVKFIAELPPTGGILTSAQLQSLKYLAVWTSDDYFIMTASVIFYLLIIYYTFEEGREMRKLGFGLYIISSWNALDLTILIFAYISFIYNIWHPIYLANLMKRIISYPDSFHSLDIICYWNFLFIDMMAIHAFCVCIKIFKYISFNKTMLQFNTTLRRCAKDLLGFGLMFLIIFLAYAQLGLLLFGTKDSDFRNFHESFLTMMRMVLGDFEYTSLEDANRVLGPIYFLTYILLVFFILLNMFLAIINDTYSDVKDEIKHGRNHLLVFIGKIFRNWYNRLKCRSLKPKKLQSTEMTKEPSYFDDNELDRPVEVVSGTTYPRQSSSSLNASYASQQPEPKSVRMRESFVLNEYFEEVPPDAFASDEVKRVMNRITIVEDLLENLILNMDRILKKVDAKQTDKYN